MKLLRSRISPGNLAIAAMAAGVSFLMIAAIQVLTSGDQDPILAHPEDAYPFSLTPDFPHITPSDEERLRSVTSELLNSPNWAHADVSPNSWKLADLATVTRGGDRIGVYGEIIFQSPTSLSGPIALVKCGHQEIWNNTSGQQYTLGGLHISLLDHDQNIYQVLPMDTEGKIFTLENTSTYLDNSSTCNMVQ